MPAYAATGATNCDVTADTCLHLFWGSSKRFKVYDFTVTAGGTPNDNALLWIFQRTDTSVGTEGSNVPTAPLDLADGAAVTNAGQDYSAEPTPVAGAEIWEQSINQRAAYSWVAAPGGEIVVPDTTLLGLGWKASHASYAETVQVTAHFTE